MEPTGEQDAVEANIRYIGGTKKSVAVLYDRSKSRWQISDNDPQLIAKDAFMPEGR